MTDSGAGNAPVGAADGEFTLLRLGSFLLRWRRTVVTLGLCGALLGLASGLLSARVYRSTATFMGEAMPAEGGLAQAASQFGVTLPSAGATDWGPYLYIEVLESKALLEPIALDTVVVAEDGARRVTLMDLFRVKGPTPARRTDLAVDALRSTIQVDADDRINAVKLSVSTKWPSVSLALAERLVQSVNQFNLEKRKSAAKAERIFVEAQSTDAQHALRESEDRLQLFLQQNRLTAGSPALEFQKDRLQRDVALRQQIYTTLVQNQNEAMIREVRDTPVITVIERPRLPTIGQARHSVGKALAGGMAGSVLGALVAFVLHLARSASRQPSEEAKEFFRLLRDVMPRRLR